MERYLIPALGWVAVIATCLFAWLQGSAAERQGAVLLLVCNLAGCIIMVCTFPHPSSRLMFFADLALAVGLLLLAVLHSSLWLGIALLLQSLALCIHGLISGGEGPPSLVFIVVNNVISLLMLACIAVATALCWFARAKAARMSARAPETGAFAKIA